MWDDVWNCVVSGTKWLVSSGEFMKFFTDNLRSDFFGGFLTLAGFMLAAKTFIVIHMKQEVYDKPEYIERFDKRKQQVGQAAATRYGPLERMSSCLYWIVVSAVVAASAQVTIGLIPWNGSGVVCIGVVAFAVFKFVKGMVVMKENLDRWFELLNDQEQKRERAASANAGENDNNSNNGNRS